METRAHYVAVGAFVLALVFLGFTAVLWLAGTQFAVNYDHYDVFFKGAVSGLSKGAAVEYNGIRVGQVSEIEIDPNNVEQIRVTVEIKSTVMIKEDAAANVETNILSGVSYILITRGTQEAKELTAHDGQRYPVIRSRRGTLASISARGPQLLEKLDDILDHVEDLLNDHNREVIAATLEHVEKLTGALSAHSDDIGQMVAEGRNALTALDKLSTDVDNSYTTPEGVKDQLIGMLKGLNLASRQIELTLQDTRPGIRTFSQHTLVDIDSLVGEMRQFIAGLSRLAAQLERDPTRLLFGDRREGYQPK
ncbi:MAG TPA: MlaD family protein [Stellaceae bacterium]|nr:MlaD family protein [Stellaceae bacterium]